MNMWHAMAVYSGCCQRHCEWRISVCRSGFGSTPYFCPVKCIIAYRPEVICSYITLSHIIQTNNLLCPSTWTPIWIVYYRHIFVITSINMRDPRPGTIVMDNPLVFANVDQEVEGGAKLERNRNP
jgi:hypothetical protein